MTPKKKHTLEEASVAAAKLFLLPSDEARLTEEDFEFLRSDLVGELLEGRWPTVFRLDKLWKAKN